MRLAPGTSVAEALREGLARLEPSSGTARLDTRLLLELVTGLSHADIIGWPDHPLRGDEAAHFEALLAQRAAGVPIAQIIGFREFWGMPFKVTADVLCPRPDSETLIELALKMAGGEAPPQKMLDLGTGTGCLLAALLNEFPEAEGVAVDISAAALAVARTNFEILGLAGRINLIEGDFAVLQKGSFDLIVSNPPYIPQDDRESLPVEVRDHEPAIALFAGADGLDAYRVLAHMLPKALARGGIAVIEAGAGQAGDIAALMRDGFAAAGREIDIVTKADLGGHERAVGLRAEPHKEQE